MARAQAEISSTEFTEWCAYDLISPGMPERGDYHAALISMVIANVNKARGPRARIEDFLLKFHAPTTKAQPMKELKTKLMAAFFALGALGKGRNTDAR